MKSLECNGGFQPASWRTKDGRLCFPTMRGLAIVNPAHLAKNQLPPAVVLERVLVNIDNKDLPLNKSFGPSPGEKTIWISIHGTQLCCPGKGSIPLHA